MGYEKKTKMKESYKVYKGVEKKETVEDILKLPILAIDDRNISLRTAQHFEIRTALDPKDGCTPIAHYFPYTEKGKEVIGFKKRDLTLHKKEDFHFTTVGVCKPEAVDLFGTMNGNSSGGKMVFIAEGEYDAAICWQVLKHKYPRGNPTALSIGFGTANAVKHIGQKHCMSFVNKFSDKVTVFDNDSATPEERKKGVVKGIEATSSVYALIPDIKVAALPEDKDPCETFNTEGSEQLYWMLMKPLNFTPEGLTEYRTIRDEAIEMPTMGKPWPWKTLTRMTLGRRGGEGIYFGAGTKVGKSTLADKLVQHIITEEKNIYGEPQKVAIFKFEEQPAETIKRVAGKFYRKDFVNPEKIIFIDKDGNESDIWGAEIHNNESYFTQEELIKAVDDVGPSIITYNNYGRCNWDELKGAIRHAVLIEHVEDVFIDPITRLTAGLSASDANQELERFADEISTMSKDLNFTYYCFCHLKTPPAGSKPHENGGKIYSNQFRGSRAMQQACYYFMGLEGNKDPEEDEKTRNTRWLVGLEDRKYGRTFKMALFYDKDTSDFIEPPEGFLDSECQTLAEWYGREIPSNDDSNDEEEIYF